MDGACAVNSTKCGGIGVLLHRPGAEQGEYEESSAHYCATTNNRMELQAAIEALDMVSPGVETDMLIYSDSTYVVGGFMWGWTMRTNTDLWEELMHLADERGFVSMAHMKRNSCPEHARADEMAYAESRQEPED